MEVFGPRRRVLVIPSATIDRVAAKLDTHGGSPAAVSGSRSSRFGSLAKVSGHGVERRCQPP
jgi:hypothetical protein